MAATMIRVSHETRDLINEIARNDYGGVSADEALSRLAREHKRLVWVEQARRLREDDPQQWAAATSEMVSLADGVSGDSLAGDPWPDEQ